MSYTRLSFEERKVIHDSKVFRLNISQRFIFNNGSEFAEFKNME